MDMGAERGAGVQVIARAARVLNVVSEHPTGMTLGEIAKRVALPRSTVQRIVKALADEDLLRAGGNEGVRLGPAFLRLIGRLHTDVVTVAAPFLQALSESIGETVTLGRASGSELAFIHVAVAEQELRVVPRVGTNLPLVTTAGGKAILALGSDQQAAQQLPPPRTEQDWQALVADLARIRQCGYALDDNDTTPGVLSLAVGIDTLLGRFAISVPSPAARLDKAGKARIVEQLLQCRDLLLTEIGRSQGAD